MNSKIKTILQALIDDEPIEFATAGNWTTSTTSNTLSVLRQWSFGHTSVSLRIKPHTIQIGEFTVPAPLRKPPLGDYFYANPAYGDVKQMNWEDSDVENTWLANGVLYDTERGAELFLAAIRSLNRNENQNV